MGKNVGQLHPTEAKGQHNRSDSMGLQQKGQKAIGNRLVSWLDRLYRPIWSGGWTISRYAFVVVAALTWGPRFWGIPDVYAVEDMVFSSGIFRLSDHWILSPRSGYLMWSIAMAGLGLTAVGGRMTKVGIALFLLASWTLLSAEALNIKAYDRLLTWIAIGLMLGPTSERSLDQKYRSPFGRWFLLVVYSSIYGSTGWLKVLEQGSNWISGKVLSYHLVHLWFGMKPLGIWLSDQIWFTVSASWVTLLAECSFPFLIWFRRTNPWILTLAASMHLGILLVMNVGPFSFISLCAYPILLHPEHAKHLSEWWVNRRSE